MKKPKKPAKHWCKRCEKRVEWYSRNSRIPCPFNPIWACTVCEREVLSPTDDAELLAAKRG